MNFSKKFAAHTAAVLTLAISGILGFSAAASAACIQYNANGTGTSSTPVFNTFCGVPNGVGDESDFVRLRADNGDPTSAANNAAYVSTLSAACNTGDSYDVRTYVHNGADPTYNNSGYTVGAGSAVAHNVQIAMTASAGTTANSFNFASTISASNATSVSDGGTLTCANGKQVTLNIVPGSVHIYSKSYGWNGLGDGAVNGTTKVGSPSVGTGDQYACWDYRIFVVYAVKVSDVKTPPTTPQVPITPAATPPKTLPNTGAGSTAAIFVIATVAGTIGYRTYLSRRSN